jgi:hypothetical protein
MGEPADNQGDDGPWAQLDAALHGRKIAEPLETLKNRCFITIPEAAVTILRFFLVLKRKINSQFNWGINKENLV